MMPEHSSLAYIKSKLGLDIPPEERKEIINNLIDLHKNSTMFGAGGVCNTFPLNIYPNCYFLAQKFDGKKGDIRKALQDTFAKFNLTLVTVDTEIGGSLLCNIAALIMGTPFGVYHLDKSQNPNVYFELGISIGVRKPFVLVKDQGANIAEILNFVHYYEMNNYFSLSDEFGDLTNDYITRIGFVDETLIPKIFPDEQNVCIALGGLEVANVGFTLASLVSKRGYQPVFLGDKNKTLIKLLEKKGIKPIFHQTLLKIAEAIAGSKFGLYRVDKSASSDTFLSLGIAVGLKRPVFLINSSQEGPPSDLSIFRSEVFEGITDLETVFNSNFPEWKQQNLEY